MEGGRPSTSTRMEEGFKFGFSRWLFLSFFWMGVGRVIVNQSNGEIKWPRVIAAGGLPGFVPGFFSDAANRYPFRRVSSYRCQPVIALALAECYWVGKGFSPGISWISRALLDWTGFYRVLPSFTGFEWVFTRFFLDLLGFVGFYWVLPGVH